ncbi:MAG TPA: hypothetical protein VKA57_13950 [Solirubrobacteraceae bacterium]|nr:hypothetical protein [Solirubrobacteraceae bacterium]
MADGWLPPTAPGANPPPRFDAPPEQPAPPRPEPPPARPSFVRPAAAGPGDRNPAAAWAIALGITGLALLVLSLGSLFLLTLPCSAAAWVLAERARRHVASGATRHGEGQAVAALWLGRIGVIVGVAALVVFIALLASGFDFEQFRDDLQRELDERRERQDGGGGEGVRTSLEQFRAAAGAWLAR